MVATTMSELVRSSGMIFMPLSRSWERLVVLFLLRRRLRTDLAGCALVWGEVLAWSTASSSLAITSASAYLIGITSITVSKPATSITLMILRNRLMLRDVSVMMIVLVGV